MFVETPRMPELSEGTAGPAHRHREGASTAGELDEHRVKVRAHLCTDEDRAAIEAHAATAGGAVDRDLAGVGPEAV
jgi:hypothetical protein